MAVSPSRPAYRDRSRSRPSDRLQRIRGDRRCRAGVCADHHLRPGGLGRGGDAQDKVAAMPIGWLDRGDAFGGDRERRAHDHPEACHRSPLSRSRRGGFFAARTQPVVRAQCRSSDDHARASAGGWRRSARGSAGRDRHQPDRDAAAGFDLYREAKMHGPEEVAFADRLFDAVEDMLGWRGIASRSG